MKRTLALFLALCLVLCLAPAAFADGGSGLFRTDDWYGRWYVSDASTPDYIGQSWDICATTEYYSDGSFDMKLWDEDYNRNELEGEIVFRVSGETAVSEKGYFLRYSIGSGDITLDPASCGYENTLLIRDYVMSTGNGAWVKVTIMLRPWGTSWDDLSSEELPHAISWYDQQVSGGRCMPDRIGADGLASAKAPADRTAVPANGQVFVGNGYVCQSNITVDASGSEHSALVKLKAEDGTTVFSFYVAAGLSATVNVPKGSYYVCFAEGDEWQGIDTLFGDETVYWKDDEICDFSAHTYYYSIYAGEEGSLEQTPMSGSEF